MAFEETKIDDKNTDFTFRSFQDSFLILKYFLLESVYQFKVLCKWSLNHIKATFILISIFFIIYCSSYLTGPHQPYLKFIEKKLLWCGYWIGLGILSSVGLGTGLHTFLLYLGPHIASVTLAAYECNSLNFPEPPYPDEIICPDDENVNFVVTIWKIMSKVRLESFMWGAGTALGELPPYFMAKASRLSGKHSEDDTDDEFFEEELGLDKENVKKSSKLFINAKKSIKTLIEKVGFFGILACASIPNPLFDLAGITCGHFLVPFGTFFGATLIGKAIIKMHIQKLFVIIAFNEHHFEWFVEKIKIIPYLGKYLHEPFREFLMNQKQSLHRSKNKEKLTIKKESWLSWGFEKFVFFMIFYFILTIVYSMAQNYQKRNSKKKVN